MTSLPSAPLRPIGASGIRRAAAAALTLAFLALPSFLLPSTPAQAQETPTGRVVVWVDLPLASADGLQRAAAALSREAPALAAIGSVEVLLADPLPAPVAPPSRDPGAIAAALAAAGEEAPGAGDRAALRRDFAAERELDPGSAPDLAAEYAGEEEDLVRRSLAALADWLEATRSEGGKSGDRPLLVWVADGFELSPAAFYGGGRPGGTPAAVERLSAALAAGHWRLVGVALAAEAGATRTTAALAAATGGAVVESAEALAAALAGRPVLRTLAPADREAVLSVPGQATPDPLAPTDPAAGSRKPPAPPAAVLLVRPRGEEPYTGRTRFQALAIAAEVARVAFRLDGAEAGSDDRPPFTATLDLGEARPHAVEAVAFDSAGRQVGSHRLDLNEPRRAFRVALGAIAPAAGGGYDVEVEVALPARAVLERVEVWVNETLAATLRQPPFRARVAAPAPPGPADYVRAVAVLADGATLDDARLLSSPGVEERVEVNLVELFVVVSEEKTGTPVAGLRQEEFTVRQGREPKPIERFREADEVPLLLGLLVDTSESMWVQMTETKQAAAKFVSATLRDGDRSFLVDFDSQPRLVQATTADPFEVLRRFIALEPGGATALYDATLFSLTQFESEGGRRALVALTDGYDYGSRVGPRRCAEEARRLGVPVYLIVLTVPGGRRALPVADLEELTAGTGGRLYIIEDTSQLDPTYAQIEAELRNQYVLAYATERPLTPAELATVKVEVGRKGLEVRTVVAPGSP